MKSEVASDGQYDKMNEKSELEKEKPETEKKIVKKPVMEEIFTFFTKVKLQVKVLEVWSEKRTWRNKVCKLGS